MRQDWDRQTKQTESKSEDKDDDEGHNSGNEHSDLGNIEPDDKDKSSHGGRKRAVVGGSDLDPSDDKSSDEDSSGEEDNANLARHKNAKC